MCPIREVVTTVLIKRERERFHCALPLTRVVLRWSSHVQCSPDSICQTSSHTPPLLSPPVPSSREFPVPGVM